jgi:outer membrane protein TolC
MIHLIGSKMGVARPILRSSFHAATLKTKEPLNSVVGLHLACARACWCLIIFTMTIACTSVPAFARSLTETLSIAYTRNPQILAAQRGIYATHEELPIALQRFMPRVYVDGSAGSGYFSARRYQDVSGQDIRQRVRNLGLSLSQPVYDGQAEPGLRAAHALVLRARLNLLQIEQSVLQDAAYAHIGILRDREILQQRETYLQLLQRLADVTDRLVASGDRTTSDGAQVRAQEARALSALLQTQRDIDTGQANYLRAVTMPAAQLEIPSVRFQLPPTRQAAISVAREESARVLVGRVEEVLAREQADQSAGALQPRIDLILSGTLGRSVDYYLGGYASPVDYGERGSIMLQLTVPLYAGPGDYARFRQAREQTLQRAADLLNATDRAEEDASVAWAGLQTARELTRVSEQAERAQLTVVQSIMREIDARRRPLQDLLLAEQQLLDARIAKIAAKADEALLSFSLLGALGSLSAKALVLPVRLFDPEQDLRTTRWRVIGLSRADGRR